MFLHQHADLFGNIGPGCQLGDPLTDEFPFAQVALPLAGQQLL